MRLVFTLSVLIALAVVSVGAAASAPAPRAEGSAPAAAAADTLRFEVTAGQPLVVPLPGGEDARFRVVRAPALSHIAGRSFAWHTLAAERGREYVVLERTQGDRTDTLVLVVEVQ